MTQPLVLIQARTASTRLPGKINLLIGHKRMLDHVVDRVRMTGLKWMLCHAQSYPRVPEEDVLRRFWTALNRVDQHQTVYDPIIRVTADCPMLDHGILTWVLGLYQQGVAHKAGYDLVGTCPGWDGLDVEVIARSALARAHWRAAEPSHREHVTGWLKAYGKVLQLPLVTPPLRWSVDDQAGLDFVRRVFETCDLCREGVPHHTNAGGSIGGTDRHPVFDLHHLDRGDLAECRAYDILKTRMGGPVYESV